MRHNVNQCALSSCRAENEMGKCEYNFVTETVVGSFQPDVFYVNHTARCVQCLFFIVNQLTGVLEKGYDFGILVDPN